MPASQHQSSDGDAHAAGMEWAVTDVLDDGTLAKWILMLLLLFWDLLPLRDHRMTHPAKPMATSAREVGSGTAAVLAAAAVLPQRS